jgi:hypothetical protein
MKIRCSAISLIIGDGRTKGNPLSDTAKSYLITLAKENLYGVKKFDGSKETVKGNLLEEAAIKASGMKRGREFSKNTTRLENDWITGECDIYVPSERLIIDTKCSWDMFTHPRFVDEAHKKAEKAGYTYQMQGYMWLYDCDKADIDFWLFPCPENLLSTYDRAEVLIDAVEDIPLLKRVTTVRIERDEKVIEKIKEKVEICQEYYNSLLEQAT